MAYETTNPPALVSQRIGSGGKIWLYVDGDDYEDVAASGYFTNGYALGMRAGDLITVVNTVHNARHEAVVTSSTVGGASTISGGTQELTASGAVTAGIARLNLNHASVVIAATIADAANHANEMLIITDTSASGTAAHTVTLTSGMFNAAGNTIATLNAPGERLVVKFDDEGRGTIIENVGAVALSGP